MLGIDTTERAGDMPDEEVLLRSRREPWLFAVLLDRYQDAFLRKARTVVYNQEDAEEIVQETFVKIYQNAHRFEIREGASFSSWGYKILMNTAFTWYQKRKREGERYVALNPEFEQQYGADGEHTGFAHTRDAIERVLARLPEDFQTVLRLHYLERWPHKDIARKLGSTTGAIKVRIHRAKQAFRREATDGESIDL